MNQNSCLPLWRDGSSNNEANNTSNSTSLLYSFLTDNKQCLASSYMSSKGHCCLCNFTAINNDLDVLIKHLSYCHPRFTASLKVIIYHDIELVHRTKRLGFLHLSIRKMAIVQVLNCESIHSMMDLWIHLICLLNTTHVNDVLLAN